MSIEFINDDPLKGVKYDFNLIKKEYKKLGCPKHVYNPCSIPLDKSRWFVIMSERARGKTTNLLLLGMVFYKLYNTGICYLRNSEYMIMPKESRDMFSNIISWGYVDKLTDGEYNTVIYRSRRWYYAHVDDDGIVDKQDINAFCIMLSIDKNEQHKSVLETKHDFIIFDEFIERNYYSTQFIQLCDLIKTIGRERQSVMIFMLSNTLSIASGWFNELMIADVVQHLDQGEKDIIQTPLGTNVYVEILGERLPSEQKEHSVLNRLYYGFNNPKLASITGATTWAFDNYPHTPNTDYKVQDRTHYIMHNSKYYNMEICESDEGVIFVNIHPASRIYDDSIVYVLIISVNPQYRYKFGYTKTDRYIFDLWHKGLWFYSDNTTASIIESYLKTARKQP